MKLYHGTSLKRGEQILKTLKLKSMNVDRVYGEDHMYPTSEGYVYLTTLDNAIYYGNKTALLDEGEEFLMVFEIEINEDEILPDLDEIEYTYKSFGMKEGFQDIENPTAIESLTVCKSVRILGDLLLDSGKSRYVKIVSTSFKNLENNNEKSRDKTKEFVSLNNHNSEYAIRWKKEFLEQICWFNV